MGSLTAVAVGSGTEVGVTVVGAGWTSAVSAVAPASATETAGAGLAPRSSDSMTTVGSGVGTVVVVGSGVGTSVAVGAGVGVGVGTEMGAVVATGVGAAVDVGPLSELKLTNDWVDRLVAESWVPDRTVFSKNRVRKPATIVAIIFRARRFVLVGRGGGMRAGGESLGDSVIQR